MSKDLITASWVEEFAEHIALESHKLITAVGNPKGTHVTQDLSVKFVQFYLEKVVKNALEVSKNKDMTNREAYNYTKDSYLQLKHQLQIEIAKAFENAFESFIGKPVDYYCQINPVPEPISKAVN